MIESSDFFLKYLKKIFLKLSVMRLSFFMIVQYKIIVHRLIEDAS